MKYKNNRTHTRHVDYTTAPEMLPVIHKIVDAQRRPICQTQKTVFPTFCSIRQRDRSDMAATSITHKRSVLAQHMRTHAYASNAKHISFHTSTPGHIKSVFRRGWNRRSVMRCRRTLCFLSCCCRLNARTPPDNQTCDGRENSKRSHVVVFVLVYGYNVKSFSLPAWWGIHFVLAVTFRHSDRTFVDQSHSGFLLWNNPTYCFTGKHIKHIIFYFLMTRVWFFSNNSFHPEYNRRDSIRHVCADESTPTVRASMHRKRAPTIRSDWWCATEKGLSLTCVLLSAISFEFTSLVTYALHMMCGSSVARTSFS